MSAEREPGFVEDCPFCLIAAGLDARAEVICEGNDWVALFPSEPATPGHSLVIPRLHVADLWELPRGLETEVMRALITVGNAIREALNPDGLNLISSSGREAEQTVFHMHLHLVPRWADDNFGRIWPPKKVMAPRLKEELAEMIRQRCT